MLIEKRGGMMMGYFEYPVSVRYCDLGEDGLLSDAAILDMLQEAALVIDPFETGDPATQVYAWALCGWKLHVHRRAAWAEELTVRTWLREMAHHTCEREFVVTDHTGEPVILATSRWLLLHFATGKVATITDEILQQYELLDERAMDGDLPEGGTTPEGTPCAYTYTVTQRDIDTLHHMNNLHYVTLARQALPGELACRQFAHVEILYKRQIRLGAVIRFYHSVAEGKHLVEIKDENGVTSHALIWFY